MRNENTDSTQSNDGQRTLLRLHPSRVGDEKGAVVGDEGLLHFESRSGIGVFRGECDNGLGKRLPNGIDLRRVTTSRDANSNVDVGERVGLSSSGGEDEERFVELKGKDGRTKEFERLTVDADEA